MRRRWRIWRGNPVATLRLAQLTTLGAALFGGLGRGDSSLFNMLALIAVATTGWYEARFADALGEYGREAVIRGGILRLVAGIVLLGIGWGTLDIQAGDRSPWLEAARAGALFAGAALMLGGIARMAMTVGLRYAGRKLQERLDDEF